MKEKNDDEKKPKSPNRRDVERNTKQRDADQFAIQTLLMSNLDTEELFRKQVIIALIKSFERKKKIN